MSTSVKHRKEICWVVAILVSLAPLSSGRLGNPMPDHLVTEPPSGPLHILGYSADPALVEDESKGGLFRIGDRLAVDVFWKSADRIEEDLEGSIRVGNLGVGSTVRSDDQRGTSRWRIGEVHSQTLETTIRLDYDKQNPPSFFAPVARTLRIAFGVPGKAYGAGEITIGGIRVAPEVRLPDRSVCLTGNADQKLDRKEALVRAVRFPDGAPKLGPKAVDVTQELFDGLFSESGNSNWECVFWGSGNKWGDKERRIDIEFVRPVELHSVVVVSPSTYANYRVDVLDAAVSDDGLSWVSIGQYDNRSFQDERGTHLLWVSAERRTRHLRLTLGHAANATHLTVSELYVFGVP